MSAQNICLSLLVVGIIAMFSVGETNATMSCFICNSVQDTNCNDALSADNKPASVTVWTNCTICSKIYMEYTNDSSTTYEERDCLFTSFATGCKSATAGVIETTTCYCDTDYCNSSSYITVPMATLLLLVFTSVLGKRVIE